MFSTIGYIICIPFAWLVRLFYSLTGSYGVAIILFTVVTKLILFPFQMKSKKSMMRMNRMSGQLQEIQKKYANNQIKMNEEIQKLYAEEGVNPMSGCLWSFIPFPIMLALYSIIRQPITHFMMLSNDVVQQMVDAATKAGLDMTAVVQMKDGAPIVRDGITQLQSYGQINLVKMISSQLPEVGAAVDGWINMDFGFIGLDMAAMPWSSVKNFSFQWAVLGLLLIPVLVGVSQLLFSRITMKQQPQNSASASMNTTMMLMPLFTVYLSFTLPAALGLYWIAQSAFSAVQEFFMGRFFNKKLEEEESARYEARQADRKRRMEEAKLLQEQRQTPQKKTLKEKQREAQEAKAAKAAKAASNTTEAGRVGDRPYARGRSYKPDRYDET